MKKTEKIKELVLDQLRKSPIVEAACQKAGITRTTFYRWKKDDPDFNHHDHLILVVKLL